MAAKSKQAVQNGSPKEDNALQRVLHLPVVNSACNSLQKTYITTKEAYPLVASVCEAYERGIQSASCFAVWSVSPVVQKLETQFAAANDLACRGLDHLEQRIPALHKPVERVTSDLKDSITSHIQSAMSSAANTMDRILGLAAESYKQSESTMKDMAEHARSSRVSQIAEAGIDAAIAKLQTLMDFLLPKDEHKTDVCVSKETSPTSTFERIRNLAGTISQRAYKQTAQTIQHTRNKGQELAMWISGLGSLTRQSPTKAQQVLSGVRSATNKGQRKALEKGEEASQGGDKTKETADGAKAWGLVGSLAQNLQTAYLSTISSMKNAPRVAWNTTEQLLRAVSEASTKVGMLRGTLHSATGSLLETIVHYAPIPKHLVWEEETARMATDNSEPYKQQDDSQHAATDIQEKAAHSQTHGDRRSSRGHHPLPFLNFDEPLLPQQPRSPAFEVEYAGSRKSAFSPYKEVASRRRLSEGLYRPSSEPVYSRSRYTSLYGTAFKKD